MSVFTTKPALFPLWYNANAKSGNASTQFA